MNEGQMYNKPKIQDKTNKKQKNKRLYKIFNKVINGDQIMNESVDRISEQSENILNQIQSICQNYKRQTILKLMKKHNNNIQVIINQLYDTVEQQVKNPIKQSKNTESSLRKNEQNPYSFHFDQEIEISKTQFQSLFEEISLIIQQTDISRIEKNHMIENCKDELDQFVKITVGFQEQLNIADIDYYDLIAKQNLLVEIEHFFQGITKQRNEIAKKAKFKNTQEEFPSLVSESDEPSYVQKLSNEFKKNQTESNKLFQKKSQYFNVQNKQIYKKQKNSHFCLGYNENRNQADDIKILAKEYQYMDIIDIKIIYSILRDLDLCRRFLKEFYHQYKSQKRKIQTIITKPKQPIINKPSKFQQKYENKQTINHQIMKLSYEELREAINHQMKLKVVFQGASSKMSGNQKRKLQYFANKNNSTLYEYMKASKFKFLERAKQNDMNEIDLHGFFADEAWDIVDAHIENVYREYKNGNTKLRYRNPNGKPLAEIMIITGKGIHSRNRKSVLKPTIIQYCQQNDILFQEKEGAILIKLQLN